MDGQAKTLHWFSESQVLFEIPFFNVLMFGQKMNGKN